METQKLKPANIDEYIAFFPEETQRLLEELRQTIRKAAPEAEEAISYQMPTFKLNGNLVHFAAFKNHIGFYPAPAGIEAFKEPLAAFKGAKGSIQFPINQPLPLGLITDIVKYRVEKSKAQTPAKKK